MKNLSGFGAQRFFSHFKSTEINTNTYLQQVGFILPLRVELVISQQPRRSSISFRCRMHGFMRGEAGPSLKSRKYSKHASRRTTCSKVSFSLSQNRVRTASISSSMRPACSWELNSVAHLRAGSGAEARARSSFRIYVCSYVTEVSPSSSPERPSSKLSLPLRLSAAARESSALSRVSLLPPLPNF
ncbi:hypothetical protein AMECASPLE_005279 [Ameca splendens]|uniref:Uncharacterized protein n=1 Tax=Ameca splendens TaxID=208324 RepID=A0ABV0YX35_9TELE